jgi:hypothetical protein
MDALTTQRVKSDIGSRHGKSFGRSRWPLSTSSLGSIAAATLQPLTSSATGVSHLSPEPKEPTAGPPRRIEMAIDANERKRMKAGARLAATYKKEEHRVDVVAGDEGRLLYRLADGREFKSPSAAGSAVMGGVACNGWRFWSLAAGEAPGAPTKRTAKPAAKPKTAAKTKSAAQAKKPAAPKRATKASKAAVAPDAAAAEEPPSD